MADLRTLFVTSAEAHAEQNALWVGGNAYTYQYLYANAATVSQSLRGLPPRTAVLGDRSFWSYVGILGAILAGHAYVPLNPRHPIERLATILRSADVGALLIDQSSIGAFRPLLESASYRIIVVDTLWMEESDIDDSLAIDPQDGAYLLFTSGSTGEPKGVMVSHANAMAYVQPIIERYNLGPRDRATQLFDLTFDLSVHDMFACWGSGGTLYAPSETMRRAPRQFVQEHSLTCWFSTPSTAAFMARLRMLQPNDFPSLRVSLFCGEPLPKRLAEAWRHAAPHSLIENLYGPTEATIAITGYRLPLDLGHLPDVVPIGAPLPGQQAAVLDAALEPVADGEIGELCLAGNQVTAGYWRRSDLTAERFVTKGNTRWYRTGDRAVRDHLGLRFMGRIDRQVKISGHRVELLEIENVLRYAAGCESVAAIPWPVDVDGLAHGIVAMVAPESHAESEILAFCRQRLAPYMVPARVMRVDWPLNANGKTDYSVLVSLLSGGLQHGTATDHR